MYSAILLALAPERAPSSCVARIARRSWAGSDHDETQGGEDRPLTWFQVLSNSWWTS